MPSQPVALTSDVQLTPGSTIPPGFSAGTWAIDPTVMPNPSVSKYTKLTVSSQGVIYQAVGSFKFTGTLSGGGAGTTTEVVTLTASTTKLQKNESNVLRNGDSATGSVGGNMVAIMSTQKLKSA